FRPSNRRHLEILLLWLVGGQSGTFSLTGLVGVVALDKFRSQVERPRELHP
ncbi:MAG: hypothetical protein RL537_1000, partial [Actinomycetota bacterium]